LSQIDIARQVNKIAKTFRSNSKGVGAIEAIIALGILGIVALAFLGGLHTALKAASTADERSVAQSLAQSQLEYVKSQDYINYDETGHENYDLITTPDNYDLSLSVVQLDDELQKITVIAKHNYKEVFTLEDYKVKR